MLQISDEDAGARAQVAAAAAAQVHHPGIAFSIADFLAPLARARAALISPGILFFIDHSRVALCMLPFTARAHGQFILPSFWNFDVRASLFSLVASYAGFPDIS